MAYCPDLKRWDHPDHAGSWAGRPAAIVAPGPSFDDFPREALAGTRVIALNAAVTEAWKAVGEAGECVWACHDVHKIWRDGFEARIKGYEGWRLLTRRVVLPGRIGDGPYRAVGGGVERGPFPHRISWEHMRRCRAIWWYSELEGQDGYLRATETVLEIALEAVVALGASPVVLVGIDLTPRAGAPYGRPWAWKRCQISGAKFAAMRRAMAEGRERWPKDVVLAGAGWPGCPFEAVAPAEAAAVLAGAPAGQKS